MLSINRSSRVFSTDLEGHRKCAGDSKDFRRYAGVIDEYRRQHINDSAGSTGQDNIQGQ